MLTAAWRELRFHRDWPCLLCLVCNRWSYNPTDVAQRYCAACKLFLDTLPEDYGRASPAPPPHAWERPAFPAPPQPWDKPVPPAIAACGLCDAHGLVDLVDAQGTTYTARCCHEPGAMEAFAAFHGWELLRRHRSRQPPAAPTSPEEEPV